MSGQLQGPTVSLYRKSQSGELEYQKSVTYSRAGDAIFKQAATYFREEYAAVSFSNRGLVLSLKRGDLHFLDNCLKAAKQEILGGFDIVRNALLYKPGVFILTRACVADSY